MNPGIVVALPNGLDGQESALDRTGEPRCQGQGPGPQAQEQRIAELERMVGRLAMELVAAKKVSEWLRFHS